MLHHLTIMNKNVSATNNHLNEKENLWGINPICDGVIPTCRLRCGLSIPDWWADFTVTGKVRTGGQFDAYGSIQVLTAIVQILR
jgi:hypothetical protein